jgi:hypothetical protein
VSELAAAFLPVPWPVLCSIPLLLFVVAWGEYSRERNEQRCIPPAALATLPEEDLACSIEVTKESIFAMKKNVWRAVIEVGFIIFLFYSNLLIGEFERSGMGQKRGLAWAIGDVFTAANFEIATIAALIGYILFERRQSGAASIYC